MGRECIKRVILTRSREDIERDRERFEGLGFEVVPLPMIETEELEFNLPEEKPNYVIFQSAKAVRYFLKRVSIPEGAKVVAVGDKTKETIEKVGYSVHIIPEKRSAEGIVEAFPEGSGEVIWIPRSEQGRLEAIEGLRRKGYRVIPINVYRTVNLSYNPNHLKSVLEGGGFIVFASPSAVRGFFANLQKVDKVISLEEFTVVAIGKTTKKELEKFGVIPNIVPLKPLMDEVAGKIHEYWQENCKY